MNPFVGRSKNEDSLMRVLGVSDGGNFRQNDGRSPLFYKQVLMIAELAPSTSIPVLACSFIPRT